MLDAETIIAAFTEEQTAALTGLTVPQLRHWARTGFFVPSMSNSTDGTTYARLYSFRDLASLRVLHELRNKQKCPLQHLREVKLELAHLGDDLWRKTALYVLNRRVVFRDRSLGEFRDAVNGQIVFEIVLAVVEDDMAKAVAEAQKRTPTEIGRITRTRTVRHRDPVFSGTRIAVRSVLQLAADGYSVEQILREYPSLTAADVEAALSAGDDRNAA